ncbi:hypothetical protein I3843_10G071300 [Carya illinoinensis]|uniref:Stigma-specific STIG1-like protein 1 n=1 Tax=Carya illinoinensis TaxID=32201 RepID=A0A922DVI2_CARIL|nr:hypothetical protein I3760_10G073000 [Carya illinoinensis]KAG6691624.1 hypothetical protein I3842_10G072800 [Carya illinoinensis]KAG7959460.1 hypothetical protein I3843_10G071300 [Carya illinoinensis]
MKLLQLFFFLAAAMAIVAALDLDHDHYSEDMIMDMQSTEDKTMGESQHAIANSLRGSGRFLAQKIKAVKARLMTCDKAPRVCRLKNSPGRNCCNKKCVDLKINGVNCGKCERKCRYRQICCMGTCVNTLSDKKNCGGCKKGGSCAYGLCNYT